MGNRAAVVLIALCILTAGCNGLDTTWHMHQGELHDKDSARGVIEPGEDSWRFVRYAEYGEVLSDGSSAGEYDVLWEWRMEISNKGDEPFEVKAKFYLVTADRVPISSSQAPQGEEEMAVMKPGEKKVFTGQGFVDKKHIPRIVRGRGRFGFRKLQKEKMGPGKENTR